MGVGNKYKQWRDCVLTFYFFDDKQAKKKIKVKANMTQQQETDISSMSVNASH